MKKTQQKFLDKVAIVTGASSGIGRATALVLAENGAHVALGSRNVNALEEVGREIEKLGRQTLIVPTDVTQKDQVGRLVKETIARWGHVDILIANSGQYIRSPCTDLSVTLMEESMAINFYGALYALFEVLPHMMERHSGHIVLMSTMDSKTPLPPDAPYVAAKSALTNFGEVLRQELRGSGVNVSIILPGRVDTPMIDHLHFLWVSAKISPEQVATAVVNAIHRREARVMIPSQVKLLYYFQVISPGLFDWAVRTFRLQGWEH